MSRPGAGRVAPPVVPRTPYVVPLAGGRILSLGPRTLVMGILNVTPDSFADGGRHVDPDRAAEAALAMEAAGADLVDVGGESTRPGSQAISTHDEIRRVVPVLDRLAGRLRVPLSIDTRKAPVAAAALDRGVAIVNDVSGLRYDPALVGVVAERGAALVLVHSRGSVTDMYHEASYVDVAAEVVAELAVASRKAEDAGVDRDRIVLDPGLGFAKRAGHSYAVLAGLEALRSLDRPILVGPSRKSFLRAAIGDVPPEARDWGTAAAVTAAILLGAHIVRVHAVPEMIQAARVADALRARGEMSPA